MVAVEEPELAGIVLFAGPGIPIRDLMVTQQRLLALDAGATVSQALVLSAMYDVIYDALNVHTDRIAIIETVQAYL